MKRIGLSIIAIFALITVFTWSFFNQSNVEECEQNSICNSEIRMEEQIITVQFDILSSNFLFLPASADATIDFGIRQRLPELEVTSLFSLNRFVLPNNPQKVRYEFDFSEYDFDSYLDQIPDFTVSNFSKTQYEEIVEANPIVCSKKNNQLTEDSWELTEGCPIREVIEINDPIIVDEDEYVSYEVEVDASEYYDINSEIIIENMIKLEINDFLFDYTSEGWTESWSID